jgi:hypothetical protein
MSSNLSNTKKKKKKKREREKGEWKVGERGREY